MGVLPQTRYDAACAGRNGKARPRMDSGGAEEEVLGRPSPTVVGVLSGEEYACHIKTGTCEAQAGIW